MVDGRGSLLVGKYVTFFNAVCSFFMCCPHRSPLPPFWRRYVTLTHCFLYLSFSSLSRMRMLGYLVGGLVSCIDNLFAFLYLVVHLTKLLATAWTRLPHSHPFPYFPPEYPCTNIISSLLPTILLSPLLPIHYIITITSVIIVEVGYQ